MDSNSQRVARKGDLSRRRDGGRGWIRTTEGIASRFTVCPVWPLRYPTTKVHRIKERIRYHQSSSFQARKDAKSGRLRGEVWSVPNAPKLSDAEHAKVAGAACPT